MFKILLKRKSKVLLKTEEEHNENICAAVTAMKNMEAYGYTFSYELLKAMSNLDTSSIYTIYQNIESIIKDMIGALKCSLICCKYFTNCGLIIVLEQHPPPLQSNSEELKFADNFTA